MAIVNHFNFVLLLFCVLIYIKNVEGKLYIFNSKAVTSFEGNC